MTKSKRVNDNGWKPVTLEGALLSNDIEGLIGIEELTDYSLERSKKGKIVTTRVKSTEEKKVSIYFLTSEDFYLNYNPCIIVSVKAQMSERTGRD